MKLDVVIGPTSRKNLLTFGVDQVLVTDSRSLFHHHWGIIGDFRRFISITHTIIRPIFTTLGKMTGAGKIMNPQHFGSDPVDIQIPVWINPEIQIRIADRFRLRLDALAKLAEVCAL